MTQRFARLCPFGSHRAEGGLPQPADRLDVAMPLQANEMAIDVECLNLDSSSMKQIADSCGGDHRAMAERIAQIVRTRGKMHNPATGSGGMLIGRVAEIGRDFPDRTLRLGERLCTLVSLSLTPLVLDRIEAIDAARAQVQAHGRAIVFASGLYARIPADFDDSLALALCDVAGAPATVLRLVQPGETVAVLGGAGKAGVLCAMAARECVGPAGRVIVLDANEVACGEVRSFGIADEALCADLTDALETFRLMERLTAGRLADVVVNTTNVADTEGATILSAKQRGRIVFFGMRTNFQAAALGAEGLGRDVTMLIGNGYVEGWVDETFALVRRYSELRALLARRYAGVGP
ncbi:MAG: L-erythro-3,5-diaminohexanoate dehydrogenase [Hyphomicrobiales bacterium]